MNNFSRTVLLNTLVKKYNYNNYLEIGIRDGNNFRQIIVPSKIGIDPDKSSKATAYLTSDDFFNSNNNYFDLIFIDGLHHAEQVYKDIKNSIKFLSEGGTIVLHDCNPLKKFRQEKNGANGDVWKSFYFYSKCKHLDVMTLDSDQGLGIIKINDQKEIKKFIESLDENIPLSYANLEYDFLESNREKVLNLKKVSRSDLRNVI